MTWVYSEPFLPRSYMPPCFGPAGKDAGAAESGVESCSEVVATAGLYAGKGIEIKNLGMWYTGLEAPEEARDAEA